MRASRGAYVCPERFVFPRTDHGLHREGMHNVGLDRKHEQAITSGAPGPGRGPQSSRRSSSTSLRFF
jgi:hypothetical protein